MLPSLPPAVLVTLALVAGTLVLGALVVIGVLVHAKIRAKAETEAVRMRTRAECEVARTLRGQTTAAAIVVTHTRDDRTRIEVPDASHALRELAPARIAALLPVAPTVTASGGAPGIARAFLDPHPPGWQAWPASGELIEPREGDKRYVWRDEQGRFTDSQEDVGRSLSQDQKRQAKTRTKKRQGDRGDR